MNKTTLTLLLLCSIIHFIASNTATAANLYSDNNEQPVSLNEIRFSKEYGNWNEDSAYNNAYFRAIRTHVDLIIQGKIINKQNIDLNILKSKICIANIDYFMLGGLFISISFIDDPSILYDIAITSDVDPKTNKVSNHRVYDGATLELCEFQPKLTKAQVEAFLKQDPKQRLW